MGIRRVSYTGQSTARVVHANTGVNPRVSVLYLSENHFCLCEGKTSSPADTTRTPTVASFAVTKLYCRDNDTYRLEVVVGVASREPAETCGGGGGVGRVSQE
jgi:hypothetical protein